MKSVRQALAKLHISRRPFRVPGDFQSHPKSLKEILRIAYLPPIDVNEFEYEKIGDYWCSCNDPEGLAYIREENGKRIWFLSSNDGIRKFVVTGHDVYNPDDVTHIGGRSEREILNQIEVSTDGFYGITQIAFHKGLIVAPYEPDDSGIRDRTLLVALSEGLDVVGYSWLEPDIHGSWCAINPWNECLYMTRDYENTKELVVLDVSRFYEALRSYEADRTEFEPTAITVKQLDRFRLLKEDGAFYGEDEDGLAKIQGACFSRNGRLYIARYDKPTIGWNNYLYAFSALTGAPLSVRGPMDFPGAYDEIEGISIHPSGVMYVAVGDYDWWNENEFEVYAFRLRDPSVPA